MAKYIDKISNEELIQFLEDNNYMIITHLKDQNGDTFPAIERSEDRAFVRCKKINDDQKQFDTEVAYHLMKKHPGFLMLSQMLSGQYSSNIEMLVFSDFYVSKLCIFDEDIEENQKLNEAYVNFLYNKFAQAGYKNDYDNYYESIQNEDEMEM